MVNGSRFRRGQAGSGDVRVVTPLLYRTDDGGTVEVRPHGTGRTDFHVRDSTGRTVATVEMDASDASALIGEMDCS